MPFSISEIIVSDTADKVVALNWSYENADGKLSDYWKLEQPYGDTPLKDCTEAVMLKWLEEQIPNTAEDFDKRIAEAKARQQYNETLKPYTPHPDGPPTPVTQEIDVPDLPETADVQSPAKADLKSKKKKK